MSDGKTAVGLFAGIGGLELGLVRAGYRTTLLCEIEPAAKRVLEVRFPGTPLVEDVKRLKALPGGTHVVAAGFPCQDLSQAGATAGISGNRSGLVNEVFRLLKKSDVPHLILENVSFMLHLDRGRAIAYVVENLERLGFSWAYRVLDSRAFGVPQRRERVYLIASRDMNPSEVLFQDDLGVYNEPDRAGKACGFYWTEGVRGLGWAIDAVPTLKSGSTIGIPSQPAIWFPDGLIGTPDIRDAERMQGFKIDWTKPAEDVCKASSRWKLVGNAVTVDVAAWAASRIAAKPKHLRFETRRLAAGPWPRAAFGTTDGRFAVAVGSFPMLKKRASLVDFLRYPPKPLSLRGIEGFIGRLKKGNLRYPPEFMEALERHRTAMADSSKKETV
jgi:DNA (cytosine-5)-methyltransferase 1